MELIDLWYIFIRRVWLIALLFVVTVAASIGYFFYTPKIYESQAKLLVVENKGIAIGDQERGSSDVLLQTLGRSDPLKTQIEILNTKPILSKTIELAGLIDDKGQPLPVLLFQKSLTTTAISSTNIILVTYRSRDPVMAADVVNTLTKVFTVQSQIINQEETRTARLFIEKQLEVQQAKLAAAERAVSDFKRRNKTLSLSKDTDAKITAKSSLESELIRLETELKGTQAQQAALEKNLSTPDAQFSPFYNYWRSSLERIQNQITGLIAQRTDLNAQINQMQRDQSQRPPAEVELAQLVRDETIANQLYTDLLSRLEEIKIKEAARIASVRILEPATIADKHIFPHGSKVVRIGAALGLVLGLVVAFLLEFLRDIPSSILDIRSIFSTNLLGVIPLIAMKKPLFLHDNPSSLAAESMRHMYAILKSKSIASIDHGVLMITSALQGEGKSTIAANCALAFAASSKKTALVCLDLRQPSFDRLFATKFDKGITDYFKGTATFDQITHFQQKYNLHIIGPGPICTDPTELIASDKIKELIQLLKDKFDVVIIDTAPMLMGAETMEIGRFVDGIIVTVGMGISSRGALRTLNDQLSENSLPLTGIIINKYKKKHWEKYGYYGKYSYGIPKTQPLEQQKNLSTNPAS
ncbi:MAG: polysaccharide biosynthesis tyrosine autokinase [Chitinivibrionales bacterium]|nr:polysaccharide biosynthesis tyrosine autokinase [Chitinivibrionales bacterium]